MFSLRIDPATSEVKDERSDHCAIEAPTVLTVSDLKSNPNDSNASFPIDAFLWLAADQREFSNGLMSESFRDPFEKRVKFQNKTYSYATQSVLKVILKVNRNIRNIKAEQEYNLEGWCVLSLHEKSCATFYMFLKYTQVTYLFKNIYSILKIF